MLLLLHACTSPAEDASDTGAPVAEGWTLGEPVACDAPVEPAWTPGAGEVESYGTDVGEVGAEPGGVSVVEVDGEPWLVWTVPDAPTRARPLSGGEIREIGTRASTGIAQGDLDGDGATDLVLGGRLLQVVWSAFTEDERLETTFIGDRLLRDAAITDVDGDGLSDLVLGYTTSDHDDPEAMRGTWVRNEGGGTFADAVPLGGEAGQWGPAFDLVALDLDDDADPDVYVCNDMGAEYAPNAELVNDAGDLAPAASNGLDIRTSCMGVAVGDATSGALDLYVAASAEHHLLRGTDGVWIDAATASGLAPFPSPQMGWGAALGDLDNDGLADLLVGTSDFYGADMVPYPLWWFRADETGAFAEEGAARGLPQEAHSRGVVTRDLNGDGLPEWVVGDALQSPTVWWSGGCGAGHWVEVAAPSGTRVTVEAGGDTYAALVTTDAGWASSGPARAHVGLGAHGVIDRITVAPPWHAPVVLDGPLGADRRVGWAEP